MSGFLSTSKASFKSLALAANDNSFLYIINECPRTPRVLATQRGKVTSIAKGDIPSDSRTYGYDALGRLTSATGLWGSTGSMTYDALGNVRAKTIGGHILTMFYDSKNRLTNYTHIGNGPDKDLKYDDRGNVKQLGGLFFTYDKSDQPINISGTAAPQEYLLRSAGTYRYDGHKRRVKSVIDGKTIYNIYDASGTLVQVDELTDGKTTDYIGKIARIAKSGSAETITYLHHDHLGSVSGGSSYNGLVSWREQYAPFGFALNQLAVGKNQAGFTGHIHDGATGLIYMQARYYDPYIGRFLSVDPVGFTPAQPFMFGRYTYVNNDPVNAIDPDGEFLQIVAKVATRFAIGVAVEVALQAVSGEEIDFKAASKDAAAGLIDPSKTAKKAFKVAKALKKSRKACFEAGTPILTKDGKRSIETIAVGDMVWSSNPETGEEGWRRVEETFINDESTVWELTFADEQAQATKLHRVTGEHPYWVVSAANDNVPLGYNVVGAWVEVNALKPNMQVQTKSGNILTVLSVQDTGVIKRTYNFEVEEFHTYYVGDDEVLVHNACKKRSKQKSRTRRQRKGNAPNVKPHPKNGTGKLKGKKKKKHQKTRHGGQEKKKQGPNWTPNPNKK